MSSAFNILTRQCEMCGEKGVVSLKTDEIAGWLDYVSGRVKFIQNAVPMMDADRREQIISGTHPKCWQKMIEEMSEDDDGHDEE